MKKTNTYIYITFCSIFLFLGIVFFLASRANTVYKMNYQENADINYKVYLKDNNYYNGLYLSEDMVYISNLIDYIDINYDYSLKLSGKYKFTNSNFIRANVIVKNNNKLLYNEKIDLNDIDVLDYLADGININKKIRIDYQKYNDLIKPLLNDNNIDSNVVANLEVELYIVNDYDIEKISTIDIDEKSIKLVIPLLKDTIDINKEYVNINSNREFKDIAKREINNYILLGIAIFFILISVVIFIILLISIKTNDFYRHQYQKVLNKILKKYDKNIVAINDIPDMRGFDVYDVVSFEELLDTSKFMNKPIMYLEIEKNRINLFFVECDNRIYQYLMRTKK